MKVVAVLGSPRKKGASSRISGKFISTAGEKGAETETFFLNEMSYRGCQGCDACKGKSERCVQKDDLSNLFEELMTADIALFASPVYYSDVTGQFKCFFDRTWSLVKPDYMTNPNPTRIPPGKKAVLVLTQGDVADKHRDVAERYQTFLNLYGYGVHVIRATECGMERDVNVDRYMEKAEALALEMAG